MMSDLFKGYYEKGMPLLFNTFVMHPSTSLGAHSVDFVLLHGDQHLAGLTALVRPYDPPRFHRIDQPRRTGVPDAHTALQQRYGRLLRLQNDLHRLIVKLVLKQVLIVLFLLHKRYHIFNVFDLALGAHEITNGFDLLVG